MINARRWCRGWVRYNWIRAAFPEEATVGLMNIKCEKRFLVEGTAHVEATGEYEEGGPMEEKIGLMCAREG